MQNLGNWEKKLKREICMYTNLKENEIMKATGVTLMKW